MNPRIEPFKDGLGDVRYRIVAETPSWSAACRAKLELEAINERAFVAFDPPEVPAYPPNCDGNARYGQEPTQAGQVLAQAQHEAAEDGEGCGSVACVMTRGVND